MKKPFLAAATLAAASLHAIEDLELQVVASFATQSEVEHEPNLIYADRHLLYASETEEGFTNGVFEVYDFRNLLEDEFTHWVASTSLNSLLEGDADSLSALIFYGDAETNIRAFTQHRMDLGDPYAAEHVTMWRQDPNLEDPRIYRDDDFLKKTLSSSIPSIDGQPFGGGVTLLGARLNEVESKILFVVSTPAGLVFAVNEEPLTHELRVVGSLFTDEEEDDGGIAMNAIGSLAPKDWIHLSGSLYAIVTEGRVYKVDLASPRHPKLAGVIEFPSQHSIYGVQNVEVVDSRLYILNNQNITVLNWKSETVLEHRADISIAEIDIHAITRTEDTPFDGRDPLKALYVFSSAGLFVYQHVKGEAQEYGDYFPLTLTAHAVDPDGSDFWTGSYGRIVLPGGSFLQSTILEQDGYPYGYIHYSVANVPEIAVPEAPAPPPSLSVSQTSTAFLLNWEGEATLQRSDHPKTDFIDVSVSEKPFSILKDAIDGRAFWRLSIDGED